MLWLARTLFAVIAAASTSALAQEFRSVTLMSWNVENLFDTGAWQAPRSEGPDLPIEPCDGNLQPS